LSVAKIKLEVYCLLKMFTPLFLERGLQL